MFTLDELGQITLPFQSLAGGGAVVCDASSGDTALVADSAPPRGSPPDGASLNIGDTIAPAPQWLKAIQAEAKRKGLDKLKMRDINRIIAEVRSESRKTKPAAK